MTTEASTVLIALCMYICKLRMSFASCIECIYVQIVLNIAMSNVVDTSKECEASYLRSDDARIYQTQNVGR